MNVIYLLKSYKKGINLLGAQAVDQLLKMEQIYVHRYTEMNYDASLYENNRTWKMVIFLNLFNNILSS